MNMYLTKSPIAVASNPVTQKMIAEKAGATQAHVSYVLSRNVTKSAKSCLLYTSRCV